MVVGKLMDNTTGLCTSSVLTSGRLLARNSLLNLFGLGLPLIVAFFAIPLLINHIGTDRFGIIAIAWMLIGYLSLFDMGLGRALTQLVSERLGSLRYREIPGIFWTSLLLMLLFSIIGALAFMAVASSLVSSILKIPLQLKHETLISLYLLAASLPFVILSSALTGFLSSYQRFDIINVIGVPMGIFSYIGPLFVLPFSSGLVPIISVLIFGRVIAFCLYLFYCFRTSPGLGKIIVKWSLVLPLFKFGKWMTISNIVGPIMVYFDRFLIGSVISISAVAYYTTPYELVTKLLIIPAALVNVLFPTFAFTYPQDTKQAMNYFGTAVKFLFITVFPVTLIVVAGAHLGLDLWLGRVFADKSCRVLQWLAVGVLANSLAFVPFAFLQGIGKPDTTSKLHIVELVLYLPVLWWMLSHYGIEGAAIAWLGRIMVDTVCLFVLSWRHYRPYPALSLSLSYSIIIGLLMLVVVAMISDIYLRCTLAVIVMLSFLIYSWKVILSHDDYAFIISNIKYYAYQCKILK